MQIASWVLWSFASFAAIGLTSLVLQRLAIWRHRARPPLAGSERAPISVLKPLCGLDDGLADSLEQFARLQYPTWELLLGLEHPDDPAAPGLNPKVNQLITLAAHARYDTLVVSDSNVQGLLNPVPFALIAVAVLVVATAIRAVDLFNRLRRRTA